MGRGRIISGENKGLYQVELVRDTARIEQKMIVLTKLIAEFTTNILLNLEPAMYLAEIEKNTALTVLNATIADYAAGLATKEQVDAATKEYNGKLFLYQKAVRLLQLKQIEKAGLQKQLDAIGFNAENPVVTAWCADLTEDLTGEVGTIEILGERGSVEIQPGYGANAAYNRTRDGILQPAQAGAPANVFNNLAMLPGWQKFRPTYRTGRIISLNEDHTACAISLDQAKSSQQDLNVNQSSRLFNVPFSYMECNGLIFEINDKVVVKFGNQNWGNPVIIGFKDNPKGCIACKTITLKLVRDDGHIVTNTGDGVYISIEGVSGPLSFAQNYNPSNQYWTIILDEYPPADGFWIFCGCIKGVTVQYPYRYHSGDWHASGDRVGIGTYTVAIPYWEMEDSWDPEPASMECPSGPGHTVGFNGVEFGFEMWWAETFKRKIMVKSSIPYKIVYKAYKKYGFCSWVYPDEECWVPIVPDPQVISYRIFSTNNEINIIAGALGIVEDTEVESDESPSISGKEYFIGVTNDSPSSWEEKPFNYNIINFYYLHDDHLLVEISATYD